MTRAHLKNKRKKSKAKRHPVETQTGRTSTPAVFFRAPVTLSVTAYAPRTRPTPSAPVPRAPALNGAVVRVVSLLPVTVGRDPYG